MQPFFIFKKMVKKYESSHKSGSNNKVVTNKMLQIKIFGLEKKYI